MELAVPTVEAVEDELDLEWPEPHSGPRGNRSLQGRRKGRRVLSPPTKAELEWPDLYMLTQLGFSK